VRDAPFLTPLPMFPFQFNSISLVCLVSSPTIILDQFSRIHQEKIHLLENGLKALKTAFEHSKSSQAI
jgi:hypothetical protein